MPGMLSDQLAQGFNAQVAVELHNRLQYGTIAAWCFQNGLLSVGTLFDKQAHDEDGHAQKVLDYLAQTNTEVWQIGPVAEAKRVTGLTDIATTFYDLEWANNERFKALSKQADEVGDYNTLVFLEWFLSEQNEEIDLARKFREGLRQSGTPIMFDLWVKESLLK